MAEPGHRDRDLGLLRERYTLLPGATREGLIFYADMVQLLDLVAEARDRADAAEEALAARDRMTLNKIRLHASSAQEPGEGVP